MKIISHTGGLAVTNCYLIADETTKQAVLFDAPDHTIEPLLDDAENNDWDVIGLWLTHGHFDHLADHQVYRDRYPNGQVFIHPLDEPKLIKPGSRLFPLPFTIPPGRADRLINDGDELSIGSIKVRVIFTPGHAPGHVSFHLPDENVLVGGDLIIGGAVGRTDLPDSNVEHLMQSVRKIMELPEDTTLLPGHGDAATLAEERQTNPYVARILRGLSI
jgi:glyoxylase-like metal-dependent hydrolase (beta-lactamase superfamily II)